MGVEGSKPSAVIGNHKVESWFNGKMPSQGGYVGSSPTGSNVKPVVKKTATSELDNQKTRFRFFSASYT